MTKQECEQQILEKLKEIADIAKEYNPNTDYLDLHFRLSINVAAFNNENWGKDEEKPLDFSAIDFLPESEDKQ